MRPRKLVELAMVGAFIASVSAVTALVRVGLISIGTLAATPRRIADGQVWLLFSSASVVDRPIVASLASLAALASVGLLICGSRVLWLAALLGHTCSTILAISRCSAPSQKAAVAFACAGVALFAWMLRGDLTVLDSEHVFAFALGAAVAGRSVMGTVRRSESPMRPHGAG